MNHNPQGGTVAAHQQAPAPFMTYNQEEAAKASGSEYLLTGGAYPITIGSVVHGVSTNKGSGYLEFSGVTVSGEKVNFIKVYYQKKDGTPISGGWNTIQAIMGVCGIQALSFTQDGDKYFCPEFDGKRVGFFLQKKLYTKRDGSDGFSFDLKLAYDPVSNATIKEKLNGTAVQTVQRMAENYSDLDERTNAQQDPGNNQSGQPVPNNF